MASDTLNKTLPADGHGPRYALVHAGRRLPLFEGEVVIGRGMDCQIVLDSALVSRRHARLVVTPAGVVVEDLGSINGLMVDSVRVVKRAVLKAGSRIQIADEVLELVELSLERHRTRPEIRSAQTMAHPLNQTVDAPVETTERRTDAFGLLASVVDKTLAMGRAADAERMLQSTLSEVMRDVVAKKQVPDALTQGAARYAVRLAFALGRGEWVNFAVELYANLGKPLPMDVIDALHGHGRRLQGLNINLLADYIDGLSRGALSPTDRFALQRLQGLLRSLRAI